MIEPIIYTDRTAEEIRCNPTFIVKLSNGKICYHKNEERSWLQLKEWLKINPEVYIERLDFSFRDNIINIATGEEGYYFSHGVQCWAGQAAQNMYIGGYLKDGIVYRKKYIMPELVYAEHSQDSLPEDHPNIILGLIKNGKDFYQQLSS
jgi:hypothetical protein